VRAVPTGRAGNMRPAQGVIREPAPAPVMPREPAPRPVLATAAPVGLPPAPAPRVAAPRPAPMAVAVAEPAPKATPMPAPKPTPAPKPALTPKPAPHAVPVGGPWKLQLGAFGVAGNADALWARVKSMPEIAGHPRANVPVGKVMRLLATGYSEENAQSACRKLTGAGLSCMAVKD